MSNSSEISTGNSNSRRRGIVVGVPKSCWCGAQIVAKISKSDLNPYRRYYRCAFAVTHKLINDNHIFKWVDEALLDEIETLASQMARIEHDLGHLKMGFDKDIFERVEGVLSEAKLSIKKLMIVVVLACVLIVGLSRVLSFA